MEKINIRGVEFFNATMDECADYVWERYASGGQSAVFTPNSEIVQNCIDSPELYEIINSAEVIIPDGIGVVKAAKILGTPLKERIPGIEFGERIIKDSASRGGKIYFLGSKPGVAEDAAAAMVKKYPDAVFVGTHDGYFEKDGAECDAVIADINKSAADILFVCLGAPVQEKWIYKNRAKLENVKIMLALGGSLDGYSGNVKRAPEFFCRHGLEWFYRLICQPSRIGRMMKLPKFYFGTWLYKLRRK